MSNLFVRAAVKTRFTFTGREKASMQIRKSLDKYLALAGLIDPEEGMTSVFVPRMMGVDEDMRNWSLFMILEHNAIVNKSITSIIQSLARGEIPTGAGAIDPKKDVMPSLNPGMEQVQAFRSSVEKHLKVISTIDRLRGSAKSRHPVFGRFDAHRWHCMFSLHLFIHYKQAEYVVRKICADRAGKK